jgi:hypothetical protein
MASSIATLDPLYKPKQKFSANELASLGVGDKVYRYFKADELGRNTRAQWIHGKVTGYRMQSNRGPKKHLKWWTVSFDAPAIKGILCDCEELVLMKQAEATQRERKARLEQLVGTQLIVE